MLTPAEIAKKVKELEIISRRITTHLFSGQYHSAFRGKGMRFKEVREYYHGDDVRFIDWNVSARYSHLFTKVFEEERELTVILMVDISKSSLFGTSQRRKRDLITEVGAVLTFSAINNNDKVGVIFFTDKIEKYIPPKGGKNHALYIVRELLTAHPQNGKTNISEALHFFNRNTRQKSIAFIMSDFIDDNYESGLKVIAPRHDVIGLHVYDKMDNQLPEMGMVKVEEWETGKTVWLDSSDKLIRHQYHQNFINRSTHCKNIFAKAGADLLHLQTSDDYVKILQQFFKRRKVNR
ncbi:MAG: DUF58 domain-containing protein [Chitinophagaceae bacterium]|nr:DUF58 domain-containing protein [Chitinophagaceae bacterium]